MQTVLNIIIMKGFKLLLFTAIAFVFVACSSKNETSQNDIRCVEIISPTPLKSLTINDYPGRVKERDHINLAFKTGGQIEKIEVRVGEYVTKGQFLANIDSSDYVLELHNYEIQYRQLKEEVTRLKTLYDNRTVSRNDYEKASTGLEQLGIAVEGIRRKVNYTNLYAPTSGVITDVFYSESELVDAGMAVFSLLADSDMEVTFDIPASEFMQRDNFGKVWCSATFAPADLIPMRILSITPKADNNQLYKVHLAFDSAVSSAITPGMTVSVKMEKKGCDKEGVTIPVSSISNVGNGNYVLVIDDNDILRKRMVELGPIERNGCVVVVKGLNENDRIVKAGVSVLHEGEHVRVLPQPSETNVGNLL